MRLSKPARCTAHIRYVTGCDACRIHCNEYKRYHRRRKAYGVEEPRVPAAATRDRLFALREAGWTWREIGEFMGTGKDAPIKILPRKWVMPDTERRVMAIPMPSASATDHMPISVRARDLPLRAAVLLLREAGWNDREIGELLGKKHNTITRLAVRYGMPTSNFGADSSIDTKRAVA